MFIFVEFFGLQGGQCLCSDYVQVLFITFFISQWNLNNAFQIYTLFIVNIFSGSFVVLFYMLYILAT